MKLVVSIHDVSPLTRELVSEMLVDLKAVGVDRTSLLVIPDHHRKAPIKAAPGFGDWLKGLRQEGHEVVAHGFYHWRPKREGQGGWTTLVNRYYTAGEGEFYDLSEEEARELLERGKKMFGELGLEPEGFIAPAWLLGKEAENAVRESGFRYTVRLREVKEFVRGRTWTSQSMVYSVRAFWRREVSRLWNRFLFGRLQSNSLMRLSLHPVDWHFPKVRAQILRLLRRAVGDRSCMTYGEFVQDTGEAGR